MKAAPEGAAQSPRQDRDKGNTVTTTKYDAGIMALHRDLRRVALPTTRSEGHQRDRDFEFLMRLRDRRRARRSA